MADNANDLARWPAWRRGDWRGGDGEILKYRYCPDSY